MRSLRSRLLLAVGLLATCTALAVAIAARRDTRREFLRYQDIERRASFPDLHARGRAIAARLDGRCCAADALADAQAMLPRTVRVVVVDGGGSRLLAASAPRDDGLSITAARTQGGVVTIEAVRDDGQRREQLVLQVRSRGEAVRLSTGQQGQLHLVPVPDRARSARADAFLGTLDRRLVWLAGVVSLVALGLTWLVARSTTRPLSRLRDAAAALAAGHWHHRVRVEGPSEIRALAVTFNALAARLEEQHDLRRALTNDVAHELRTPLTALQCRLESVIDGVVADPVGACRALHAEVRHLTRLVDDLQDVALAEARELRLAPEAIPVRVAIDEALRLTGLAGHRRVALSIPDDAWVRADPTRLRQVLVNLLANARQHAPDTACIRVRAMTDAARVAIEVENTGSHVQEAHLPHLFDRFYRVDPSRQRATGGSGLGLAIVKHLVEAHGGAVWARSTADTVIVGVRLPATKADATGSS